MTQTLSKGIILLAGTTCCSAPIIPSRKSRRLPGTVTGKPGVRHFAGTVFAHTTFDSKN